ncbi:meiotic recombination [Microbotryomycetes sp. JL201]|nr:meiotic recombination [Microbotryomycetes sp. JL201]
MSSPTASDAGEGGYLGPTPTLRKNIDPDDCVKILLATDNHIGYAENDPVRGRDSINTFREILQLAVANDVDMVLLAGDLFHENRPTRTSLYQTMDALRQFTMGSRPIGLEVISEAGFGIERDVTWPNVNYEDENLNVGLPVFSIHGNHDDPQGTGSEGALCALDLLAASGLINYFGRLEIGHDNENEDGERNDGLQVKPVLLQKGSTKLALYGMGNVRDERFHHEMRRRRIKMFRPLEDKDDWFNIVLVHQNRVPHGPNKHTPDHAFGDEAHLVVWGHEHDCIERATPQPVSGRPYYIVQPGSSIATSLARGESIPKHVSLIKIQGKEFEFEPIRLRTVRPFIFEEISLSDIVARDDSIDLSSKVKVTKYLKMRVTQLIDRANRDWDELHAEVQGETERMLPLIRLRVDYSGGPTGAGQFEIGNPQRFGQEFVDRVANPRDIVQFHRKSTIKRAAKIDFDNPDEDRIKRAIAAEGLENGMEKLQMSSLVTEYLKAQELTVLPSEPMQDAIDLFVDKGDKDAFANLLKKQLKDSLKTIESRLDDSLLGPDENLDEHLRAAKEVANKRYAYRDDDEDGGDEDHQSAAAGEDAAERDSMDDSSDAPSGAVRRTAPQAAAGKHKAAATTKTTAGMAKAKGRQKALFQDDDDSDDVVHIVSDDADAPPTRASAKAPVRASTTRTSAKAPARKAAAKVSQRVAAVMSTDDSDSDDEPPPARKRKR